MELTEPLAFRRRRNLEQDVVVRSKEYALAQGLCLVMETEEAWVKAVNSLIAHEKKYGFIPEVKDAIRP